MRLFTAAIAALTAASLLFASNAAAAERKVVPSSQVFVVDGKTVVFGDILNVDGFNYVKAAALAKELNTDVVYDGVNNLVVLDKSRPYRGIRLTSHPDAYDFKITTSKNEDGEERWDCGFGNPYADITAQKVAYYVGFEFVKGVENGQNTLVLTDRVGAAESFEGFSVGSNGIGMSFYQMWSDYNHFPNWRQFAVSDPPGGIEREDTAALREGLGNVFRVFVNGELRGGTIEAWQGNGHSDMYFTFDETVALAELRTLRVELGYIADFAGIGTQPVPKETSGIGGGVIKTAATTVSAPKTETVSGYKITESPQKFVVNGKTVPAVSLNADGYNYVKAAEFAEFLDMDIAYDRKLNKVAIDTKTAFSGVRDADLSGGLGEFPVAGSGSDWSCEFDNPHADFAAKKPLTNARFVFTKSADGGETSLALTYCKGTGAEPDDSLKSVAGLKITSKGVSFTTKQSVGGIQWSMSFEGLDSYVVYENGVKIRDDVSRLPAWSMFTVFVNGDNYDSIISGKLAKDTENGYVTYTLMFDKALSLSNVTTIRVDIGDTTYMLD